MMFHIKCDKSSVFFEIRLLQHKLQDLATLSLTGIPWRWEKNLSSHKLVCIQCFITVACNLLQFHLMHFNQHWLFCIFVSILTILLFLCTSRFAVAWTLENPKNTYKKKAMIFSAVFVKTLKTQKTMETFIYCYQTCFLRVHSIHITF